MAFHFTQYIKSTTPLAIVALLHVSCYASASSVDATLSIDLDEVVQTADPHRLTGTNLSLWSRLPIIENANFQEADAFREAMELLDTVAEQRRKADDSPVH